MDGCPKKKGSKISASVYVSFFQAKGVLADGWASDQKSPKSCT